MRVKKRKRSRVGASTIPNDRLVAEGPNHVWALDFAYDQTADYRTLKYLNITDEFTKHSLAIEVVRSMTGDDIVTVLERLIMIHGAPRFVRMDNGTEMTSNTVADWCRFSPTGIAFIDPGSPWQNAYVESFTGRLRDELLAVEIFHTLLEAKIMAEDHRQHYNRYRPHSSLGYLTPDEFALQWTNTNPGLTKSLAHQPGAGQVMASGFPQDVGQAVTFGQVTGRDPQDGWITSDALAGPGNSGGPLVYSRGEVIGVVGAVFIQVEGISASVPIDRLCEKLITCR